MQRCAADTIEQQQQQQQQWFVLLSPCSVFVHSWSQFAVVVYRITRANRALCRLYRT